MSWDPDSSAEGTPGRERDLINAARRQLARCRASQIGTGSSDAEAPGSDGLPGGSVSARDLTSGYEILREVHRGGQGVVYLAVQKSTRRQVAIKVMRDPGRGGIGQRNRFEREVHLLAQLSHPNIVTIHDSGLSDGASYLVMDYVAGLPLDAHVSHKALARDQVLELLAQVCDAVNAAHLRGVIHRDLKPSNIRVTADGQPRVLDFGLAKAMEDSNGTETMTMTGQFVGSLPWASPEQAGGSAQVDVRTDVYSLGVILYQLLTGRFPYDVGGSLRQALDRIAHAEPPPPSRMAESKVDSELDTITLKCLAKDPERRYQNAGELARDIRHHLRGDPIEARRDSFGYVLRKQIQRHRLLVGFSMTAVAFVTVGFVVTLALWRDADQQRNIAQTNLQRARDAETRASSEAERALREADMARRVKDVLVSMFETTDPYEGPGGLTPARELLDAGLRSKIDELSEEPLIQAELLLALGVAYRGLGLYDEALAAMNQSLALRRELYDRPAAEVSMCLEAVGAVYSELGQLPKGEELLREALAIRRVAQPSGHPDIGASASSLANVIYTAGKNEEAEELLIEAEAILRAAPPKFGWELSACLNNFGMVLSATARYAEANAKYEEAVAILERIHRENTLQYAVIINNWGVNLNREGKFAEGEPLLRRGLELRRKFLGDRHPAVGTALNNLGRMLTQQGRLQEARNTLEEALELRRSLFSQEHPSVANTMDNLAAVLEELGELEEAESLMRTALDSRRAALGNKHPKTVYSLNNLAGLLKRTGQPAEAEELYRQALEISEEVNGPEHPTTGRIIGNLAGAIENQGRFSEAKALYERSAEVVRQVLGAEHPDLASSLFNLGLLLLKMDAASEAEPLLREAVRISELVYPGGHWQTAAYRTGLGDCLTRLGAYEESETELLAAHEGLSEVLGAEHPRSRRAVSAILRLYDALGDEAARQEWSQLPAIDEDTSQPTPALGDSGP